MTRRLRRYRLGGAALEAFLIVQLVYLYFDLVAVKVPAYGAPMAAWRAMILAQHDLIRWHILLPLFNAFCLLMPASVALKQRLEEVTPQGSVWPELVVPGAALATATVFVAEIILAVFGLVPEALSDSILSVLLMANTYCVFVAANLAGSLLVGAASLAMLESSSSSGALAWMGVVTAGAGLLGALWLASGNMQGPLFALTVLSRALLLLWLAAAGVWLYRTAEGTASFEGQTAGG